MSLYPSLEDLKVDKVIQAQTAFATNPATPAILSEASASSSQYGGLYPKLYPELSQYMGLSLSEDEIHKNMSMVPSAGMQVARPSAMNNMVAPVTGSDLGIRRAEIKQGLREVILCKDQDGKIGLRLKSIDNGIFVQLVQANSPASLAGLKFGDQVLQINGENCAGWSSEKSHKFLKQAAGDKINMVIRDRINFSLWHQKLYQNLCVRFQPYYFPLPSFSDVFLVMFQDTIIQHPKVFNFRVLDDRILPFERTMTMHKDSSGHIGFIFKNGKITSIVKDSSAARNGLLTEHNLCEINGQNVIGLKDSQVADLLAGSANVVTLTVIPSYIFEHMVKRMASSVMKNLMDHSVADV